MIAGKVGLVTVTFNSAKVLDDFLASVDAQDHGRRHTYIIDNDSKDDTVAALERRRLDPQHYTLIANATNVGVAAGNNQGIQRALADGCEWVLLVNNDTVFPARLVGHLIERCAQRGWRAVVPKIHFDAPAGAIWFAGGGFDPYKGHTGYHSGIGQPDRGQFDATTTIDYAPTCCMLIHRTVFQEIGLMDEVYFAYFDDTDFCWRMKQHGIELGYTPAQVLVHKVGGSTGGITSPFFAFMTARNRLYFLRKHFSALAPWLWLPIFLPYYAGRYLLRSWNPPSFRASLRGTLAYRSMVEHTPPIDASASPRSTP